MKIINLFKKLEGMQNIASIMTNLGVNRQKATYYICRLRKEGYVKTRRLSDNKRVYSISFENKLGGKSYHEIINKYSPIKIAASKIYNIYDKEITLEETLIYAIKTRSLRTILASLALFKKINNWSELYQLAKQNNLVREVCALYDLARKIMKIRKMNKNFINNALPKKKDRFRYIIKGLKSKNYQEIEKKWKIHLPFNKADLEAYI